ncbi:hypothetical protein ACTFIW_004797 [Dictyostelium discoideum]
MTTKIVTQTQTQVQTQTPIKPPRLIDLSVSCCSSESEYNKSSNVLLDDTYRIWQTKDKTGKAFIELQFPTPSLIHQIDITNAGSAFIEVLVGLVTWEPTEFLVLVPLTNFMSLSETTNKTNRNRMKSFNTSNFSSQTVPRKWERVRIVCSQPWLDDNLGVSLVKIYAPPLKTTPTPTPTITTTKLSSSSSNNNNNNNNVTPQIKSEKLGDSSNEIDLTDTSASNLMDTSFESEPNIPLKSDKTQILNFIPELKRSNSSTPKKLSKSATVMLSNPLPGQVLVINQKSKSKGVNKEPEKEIETEEEDEEEKIEIKKKLDQQQKKQSSSQQSSSSQQQQQQQQKQKSKLVEPKQSDEDDSMQDIKIINNNRNENQTKSTERKSLEKLTNTNDGETDEECDDLQIIATPKQQQKLTPFGNLLKGVVLVIGGIQNPQRGEIREKALEMGAGYKPDWCREATHLVTPFRGTDKFKIAQKSGGSIIKPKWIEDCYKLKSRLPIKNYTFQDHDDSDGDGDGQQDDIAEKIASAKKAKKTISTDSTSKKRKKKGAPGSDDSDDDSHIPNVYDYNDGFIDNSFSSSEASDDDKEKDPDHVDDHVHENVDDLLNDGLDYLKRTYGYKPDRDLIQHNPYHKKQKNHHSSDNNNNNTYKSSPSYKPNKYYNEEYDNDNNNNNNSSSGSSKNKTNNNDNDDESQLTTTTTTKNKDKKEKEEKISYKPKQQKLDEFDDDSLFDNHDTVLMTPEQIKEEIDRLVNNYNNGNDNENNENSNNKNNNSNNNNSKNNKSTINGPTSPNKSTDDYLEGNSKKLSPSQQSSQQSSQSTTNKNQVKDSIIPEKCSTQLPKNNPHDFKGKEYILNPLPSFFEGFEFYLSVKDEALRKNIVRLTTAYKGSISSIPTNSTKFIITDKTVWDRLFDITKQKYPNVLFLSPSFIMQSHNYQKLSPIDKHLILKSK